MSKSAHNFLVIKLFRLKKLHLMDKTIMYAFMKKKLSLNKNHFLGALKI